jgi:hypothetical protein
LDLIRQVKAVMITQILHLFILAQDPIHLLLIVPPNNMLQIIDPSVLSA